METAIALRAIMEREELTQEQVANVSATRADVIIYLFVESHKKFKIWWQTTLERTKA